MQRPVNSSPSQWICGDFAWIHREPSPWMREFILSDWFTATRRDLIRKWQRIHVIGMDSFLSAVNSQTFLVNSHLYLTNSRLGRWIPSWIHESTVAKWEFISRLIRIHVLQDEFFGMAMNSLAVPWIHLKAWRIPPHLYELATNQCEFWPYCHEFTLWEMKISHLYVFIMSQCEFRQNDMGILAVRK